MVLQAQDKQFDMVAATEWARDRHGRFAAHMQADEQSLARGLQPIGLPDFDRSRTAARFSVHGGRKHA